MQNPKVTKRIAELQAKPAIVIVDTEMTTEKAIDELEDARKLAIKKGQASAAVSATIAKARLAGLLTDKPESKPMRTIGFDGNYTEAARRVALLLRLADKEKSGEIPR